MSLSFSASLHHSDLFFISNVAYSDLRVYLQSHRYVTLPLSHWEETEGEGDGSDKLWKLVCSSPFKVSACHPLTAPAKVTLLLFDVGGWSGELASCSAKNIAPPAAMIVSFFIGKEVLRGRDINLLWYNESPLENKQTLGPTMVADNICLLEKEGMKLQPAWSDAEYSNVYVKPLHCVLILG